jgi:hypothetical protein
VCTSGKMCIEVDPTSKISYISEEVRVCRRGGACCTEPLDPTGHSPCCGVCRRLCARCLLLSWASDVHRLRYLREEVPVWRHFHHQLATGESVCDADGRFPYAAACVPSGDPAAPAVPCDRTWKARRRTASARTRSSCTVCPCRVPMRSLVW